MQQASYCDIDPFEPIEDFPYREIIEDSAIKHFRKLRCEPTESFAAAVLFQFCENLLRESTPHQQFVKQLSESYPGPPEIEA